MTKLDGNGLDAQRLLVLLTPINMLIGAARSADGLSPTSNIEEWKHGILDRAEDARQAVDSLSSELLNVGKQEPSGGQLDACRQDFEEWNNRTSQGFSLNKQQNCYICPVTATAYGAWQAAWLPERGPLTRTEEERRETVDDLHAAFEKWVVDMPYGSFSPARDETGRYVSSHTHLMWLAWNASHRRHLAAKDIDAPQVSGEVGDRIDEIIRMLEQDCKVNGDGYFRPYIEMLHDLKETAALQQASISEKQP